jgi:hypothetical protein
MEFNILDYADCEKYLSLDNYIKNMYGITQKTHWYKTKFKLLRVFCIKLSKS